MKYLSLLLWIPLIAATTFTPSPTPAPTSSTTPTSTTTNSRVGTATFGMSVDTSLNVDDLESTLSDNLQSIINSEVGLSSSTRRLSTCVSTTSFDMSVDFQSQGLTSSKITNLVNSASKSDLFGSYASDVCSYSLKSISISSSKKSKSNVNIVYVTVFPIIGGILTIGVAVKLWLNKCYLKSRQNVINIEV